ncbi:MAG TPA: hypothetical protein VFW73_04365 [Lacipirellulaceae bacterium]|nr:hypothetical protein [Lacipirellulaceae bacterium]
MKVMLVGPDDLSNWLLEDADANSLSQPLDDCSDSRILCFKIQFFRRWGIILLLPFPTLQPPLALMPRRFHGSSLALDKQERAQPLASNVHAFDVWSDRRLEFSKKFHVCHSIPF